MTFRSKSLFVTIALLFWSHPGMTEEHTGLTEAQRAEVETIVRDLITKKDPGIVQLAIEELQRRETAATEIKTSQAIASRKEKIERDPSSPVTGNANGDVTIVEFYDYQCPYCKTSQAALQRLIDEDGHIKFIHKEYPILGPLSVTATRVALASVRQDKYPDTYKALMAFKGHFSTEDDIFKAVGEAGLDIERLKLEMANKDVTMAIQESVDLGTQIGVEGTPMFIIGGRVYPGALDFAQLKTAVGEARRALR